MPLKVGNSAIRLVTTVSIVVTLGCAVWGAIYWFAIVMPGRSHDGPLPPLVEEERLMAITLRSHVEAIAVTPRNTGFPIELDRAARLIESQLTSLGYTPLSQWFEAGGVKVRNIEVTIEPVVASDQRAVETLVVGAHYDTAAHSPGANDNGSGVSALLVLARDLKQHQMVRTRVRLVFFVNEEPPHFKTEAMGSLVYARALAATGEPVRGMLSLESLGAYFDAPGSQKYPRGLSKVLGFALPEAGNFVAFVGTPSARRFVAEVTRQFRDVAAFPSVGGVAPAALPGITWSDHWSFGLMGIPAIMITDTAPFRYPHYHLPSDTPEKLDYERLARVTSGIVRVVRNMAP